MTLNQLKKRAKKLYLQANAFGDLDCGREMAEQRRPGISIARNEFERVWRQIMELDPKAPESPFAPTHKEE